MYIASRVFVLIADLFYVLSMFAKNKKWLLILLVVSNIFFGAHFMFLNAFTGGYVLIADIVFLIVAYILNEKNQGKYIFFTSLIFVGLTGLITGLTWAAPISLLPMFGMMFYFVGMGFDVLNLNKIGRWTRNLCGIVYMFLIASYVGASLEIVLLISAIVGVFYTNKQHFVIN